ncbi:hypothetical protein MA16_Dca000276 [Dendrobium catenatum]|uniref:GAG-pre-integrase domain-containing protein n=1 Tax=Dendrobium catenatum TaxID=906689 RepID=A0A2I0WTD9_9ASPA|nr:hypothetical protein MA16_Dca000276 [Dendrobium catenatum]
MINLDDKFVLEGKKINNIYILDFNYIEYSNSLYLKIIVDESWLWHRRLCHTSMKTLRNITHKSLVRCKPKLDFTKDHLCDACHLGK